MQAVVKIEVQEDPAAPHVDVQVKQEPLERETETQFIIEVFPYHEVKEEVFVGPLELPKPGPSTELGIQDVTASSSVLTHPSRCGLCGLDIASSSSLMQHTCAHAANTSSRNTLEQAAAKFTCDICKRDFKTKGSLTRHILHIHNFLGEGKSQLPREKFFTARKKKRGRQKLFRCNFCNKKFLFKSKLISHERMHTGDKPFSCSICNEQFSQRSNLIRHRLVHSADKPHLCKICNKTFSRSSSLILHQRTHSGVKPYSCKFCSKKFSQSSSQISHQRIHSGDKPYSCKICNKRFSHGSNLTKHQRVHSGDKPYTCKICDRQFSDKSALNRHERGHTSSDEDILIIPPFFSDYYWWPQ